MLNILFTGEKIAAENCHIVWSIFNFIPSPGNSDPCKQARGGLWQASRQIAAWGLDVEGEAAAGRVGAV